MNLTIRKSLRSGALLALIGYAAGEYHWNVHNGASFAVANLYRFNVVIGTVMAFGIGFFGTWANDYIDKQKSKSATDDSKSDH